MRVLVLAVAAIAMLGTGCKSSMRPESVYLNGTVRYTSGQPNGYAWVQPSAGDGVQADASGHYLLKIPAGVDPVTVTATEHQSGDVTVGAWVGTITVHVGRGATQDIVLDRFQPI